MCIFFYYLAWPMWELLTPDLNKVQEKQWNQHVVAFLRFKFSYQRNKSAH